MEVLDDVSSEWIIILLEEMLSESVTECNVYWNAISSKMNNIQKIYQVNSGGYELGLQPNDRIHDRPGKQ